MATIQNYRDQQLQATDPRLILVPSNYIALSGTGNTFEVRGDVTQPSVIIVTAVPQGHIINQTVTFSLVATTGHTLSVSGNTAIITGSATGSDICTLKATISYQGLTYESFYTINKIMPIGGSSYKLTTSVSSVTYDSATTTFNPTAATGISVTSTFSSNGTSFTTYSGRYTIHVSTNGGLSWGTAQYTSSSNESIKVYGLTGVTSTTTNIRFRLHKADETPSDSNVLATTILPIIPFGYTGSGGTGINGRSVNIYIGSAPLLSIYGNDGYLASSYNIPPDAPVYCTAQTYGYVGTKWYRWSVDNDVVSDWATTNNTYNYTRQYLASNMPDILKVEVADGYTGSNYTSNIYGVDYLTFTKVVGSYVGSNVPVFSLSNELHTVPFNNMFIGSYLNSGTLFYGYEGTSILTFKEELNTYPISTDTGKYNVERIYTNLTSGGAITGQNTTVGSIPDHTNLSADAGILTVIFRARMLNGDEAPVVYKVQNVYRSVPTGAGIIGSGYINSGTAKLDTSYNGSALANTVNFTDLEQVFWPGNSYSYVLSGGMEFAYKFVGQNTYEVSMYTGSNGYQGSGIFEFLDETPPAAGLYLASSSANYKVGVACDPMDHPVIFGMYVV